MQLIVAFNARSGERNGRRVRRTKEAHAAGGGGGDSEGEAHGEKRHGFFAERNPNAVKYVGNRTAVRAG